MRIISRSASAYSGWSCAGRNSARSAAPAPYSADSKASVNSLTASEGTAASMGSRLYLEQGAEGGQGLLQHPLHGSLRAARLPRDRFHVIALQPEVHQAPVGGRQLPERLVEHQP